MTASWRWTSPAARPSTPSTRTRRVSWTLTRVTSSPSANRWMPTGTRGRCAAARGSSPSATWMWWCLCRYRDRTFLHTFKSPGGEALQSTCGFLNNMQQLGSSQFCTFFQELISSWCVTGRRKRRPYFPIPAESPASRLGLALVNTAVSTFPFKNFLKLITNTKPFTFAVHFNQSVSPHSDTIKGNRAASFIAPVFHSACTNVIVTC